MTLLLDAIELATYIVFEDYPHWSMENQRDEVTRRLQTALTNTSGIVISGLTALLHPVFVAKAETSIAESGCSVAARLIDKNDPFRLGVGYIEPTGSHPLPNVTYYLDDTVISPR